jgi:hypothetical protein
VASIYFRDPDRECSRPAKINRLASRSKPNSDQLPRQQTTFPPAVKARYDSIVKILPRKLLSPEVKIGLAVIVVAAATGVAFAAWVENGAAILMAMAETGLSWCF